MIKNDWYLVACLSCPKTIFADKNMKISSDTQLERNSENSDPTFVLEPFLFKKFLRYLQDNIFLKDLSDEEI